MTFVLVTRCVTCTDQTNSVKALEETSWSSRSGLNPTRTTPPCYNNATLGNRLYAQHKGPNVTNPICWTCKNCSRKCAADCELNSLAVLSRSRHHAHGTHYHLTFDRAVLFRHSNDISRPICSHGLNLAQPAPLYPRTL